LGEGAFGGGGDVPKNKHTALLGYRLLNMLQNLNTTLFVLCGHHIVLTMVSVQDWLNVCLFFNGIMWTLSDVDRFRARRACGIS